MVNNGLFCYTDAKKSDFSFKKSKICCCLIKIQQKISVSWINWAAKTDMSCCRLILNLSLLLSCVGLAAQSRELMASVIYLTGAESVEEIDSEEIERFERLAARPVDMNWVNESRLRETGLFSTYQLASLREYRNVHGDIMSLTELSMVDGFSAEFVNMIALFISFGDSYGSLSLGDRWENKLTVRAGIKPSQTLYGLKYSADKSDRFGCSLALNHAYASKSTAPETFTGNCSFTSSGGRLRIIAGDYNARFGQGLSMWNGLNVGGLTSTSGFYRKASGISPSSSFTGSMAYRGIAAEYSSDNWNISLLDAVSFKDGTSLCSAVNLSRFMKKGRVGLTHYAYMSWQPSGMRIPDMNTSADLAFCLKGTDLFAEMSLDWVNMKTALLTGVVYPLSDRIRMASMLRYYPADFSSRYASAHRSLTSCTNEYAAAVAADFHMGRSVTCNSSDGNNQVVNAVTGTFSMDMAYFPVPKSGDRGASMQMKCVSGWAFVLFPSLKLAVRLSERIRTWGHPLKTGLRTELDYVRGNFSVGLRTDISECDGVGMLAFIEGGYRSERFGVFLRQGTFFIDDWDDRIYVYERDAPGSFSVPAFYGRGLWTSLTGNWKPSRWMKLYFRVSATSYPFMDEQKEKPGKAELKLQCVFSI